MNKKSLTIKYPDCGMSCRDIEKLIKDALSTHAKFGHIDGDLSEAVEVSTRVLAKNLKLSPDESHYHKSKNDSAWDLMTRFENNVETRLSDDLNALKLLSEVSLETIKGFEQWKCTPLWGISSSIIDMGDGHYRIKHDKDIDSSG